MDAEKIIIIGLQKSYEHANSIYSIHDGVIEIQDCEKKSCSDKILYPLASILKIVITPRYS